MYTMFLPRFLVINLAVMASCGHVTHYATFEDLDMLLWPVDHVGVMAMESDGTIWVIHNNGNGTYSLTWHKYWGEWGSHRLKISDWQPSANGTTVEGAVQVGSPKYHLILDNCYDTRDAIVRYFSSGNGTSTSEHPKTCPPNRSYCGHDPVAQALKLPIKVHPPRHILISCGGDNPARIDVCAQNCSIQKNKIGQSSCECTPTACYCGYEMRALGGWDGYDNHTLYLCLDGASTSVIKKCSTQCIATQQTSICAGNCQPNGTYCGHELLQIGFEGYDSNVVYRCDDSGRSALALGNCSQECVQKATRAYCPCQTGRIYCMHELYTQMNWWFIEDAYGKYPHYTVQCDHTRSAGTTLVSCINCTSIAHQGNKDAYCQWTPGVFCGRHLHAMGWPGYENDTLYLCGEEARNVSVISRCKNGTCQEKTCHCIPKQTYCGDQLYWMGWKGSDIDEERSNLDEDWSMFWLCGTTGRDAGVISTCKSCTHIDGHARCTCRGDLLYCGHEMEANPPYDANTIYRCNYKRYGNDTLVQPCHGACIRVTAKVPVCLRQCTPGKLYCGSKLHELGFTGLNKDNIYSCSADGQNFTDTGRADALCTRCTPGQSYCGHQINHQRHLSEKEDQQRYVCNSDGTLQKTTACTTICINRGNGAYCQCVPGQQHCGRDIYSNGWQVIGESVLLPTNFTNDTLFRCVEEEKIAVVEQCEKGECWEWPTRATSTCFCSPGRKYCGHELYPGYTDLYSHHIYQCSESKLWARHIEECGTCVSISGQPKCRRQCIPNSRYCGSDLSDLEGWDVVDSQILYQCTNGSFASPEQNCTAGCRARNGDVDAYCLGMPTPWYWFFMGTTLPAVFIVLCLWLVRTIIKHRRLRNFVRQHRINASQLTLVRKLGHGQFGEVWQGVFTDNSREKTDVALKISKHSLNSNSGMNLASANCFFQESVALDFLRHKNITKALGICSNFKMSDGLTAPALVLEYMDGGNSAGYVLAERDHLQTPDLMRIFVDICRAGEHLHKMGVIHRDIGARNVLIRKNPRNGKPLVAKLTDFRLAKDVGKSTGTGVYKSMNAMFHEGYTAPEGFRGEFSSQSDIWSFGVFVWEIYTLMDKNRTQAVAPYSDLPSQEILAEIGNGYRLRRPLLAPTDVYSIMTSCWTWGPESRPTFRQLRKTFLSMRSRDMKVEIENSAAGTGSADEGVEARLQDCRPPIGGGYGSPHAESPESQVFGLVNLGTPVDSSENFSASATL